MSDPSKWTYSEQASRNERITQASQRNPIAVSGSSSAVPRDIQQRPQTTALSSADQRYASGSLPQNPSYLTSAAGPSAGRTRPSQSIQDHGNAQRDSHGDTDPVSNARRNYHEFVDESSRVVTRIGRAPSQSSGGAESRRQQALSGTVLLGTPGEQEALHPAYKKRDQPKRFFVIGKVFLVLWVEPKGESLPGFRSVATYKQELYGKYGEPIYSDIRRFVVVRMGEQSCTALPIRTYSGKGAVQRRDQAENGIIYIGKQPPRRPRLEPELLPNAIRVDPDNPDDKLDVLSRINYSTVYTIEHNVKVRPCGMVNRDHLTPLLQQFKEVFVAKIGVRESQPSVVAMNVQLPSDPRAPGRPSRTSVEEDDDATKRRATQRADLARHIAAARMANNLGRRRSRHEDRTPTAGSAVSGAADDIDEDSDEGSDQSGDDDDEAGGRRIQLAQLTSEERQRLRASFARVEAALIQKGYSQAKAAIEAKAVVATEVAKLSSNAREKSRVSESRRSQDVRSSADAIGASRSAISDTSRSNQFRRETVASSSQRSAGVLGVTKAMQGLSMDMRVSGSGRSRSSDMQDRESTITSERRLPDTNYTTAPPQRTTQPPIGDVALSAEALTQRGWSTNEIVAYGRLVAGGWRPSAAQTIITLNRRGLSLATATDVARLMEDGCSLEEASARIRGSVGDPNKSTKGKEKER
nr:hypothetical protein B0A51_03270 [Rachicladosporium sp. CCFEE 5018]